MTNCNNCGKEPTVFPDWKKAFVSREDFLKTLCLTLSGVIGLLIALPGAGFVFNYFLYSRPLKWIPLGPLDKFQEGQTVNVTYHYPYSLPWDGVSANRTAWLRRLPDGGFEAFAINCTHLGCPVRWEAGADLFMCPCHGGVFYSNGEVAGGPPPRPLHRYLVRVNEGQVELGVYPALTGGGKA